MHARTYVHQRWVAIEEGHLASTSSFQGHVHTPTLSKSTPTLPPHTFCWNFSILGNNAIQINSAGRWRLAQDTWEKLAALVRWVGESHWGALDFQCLKVAGGRERTLSRRWYLRPHILSSFISDRHWRRMRTNPNHIQKQIHREAKHQNHWTRLEATMLTWKERKGFLSREQESLKVT